MRTEILRVLSIASAAVLGTMTMGMVLQADRPRQQQDVTAQLLQEVRAVRTAIEQLASVGPRIQLALGRLQQQEQRIAALQRRLDAVRDQINAADRGAPAALKEEEASLQRQIATEQNRRADVDQRLDELERTLIRR